MSLQGAEHEKFQNSKRKWPPYIVIHFILIAWIMELISKANVFCFIAFHIPASLLSQSFSLQWRAN